MLRAVLILLLAGGAEAADAPASVMTLHLRASGAIKADVTLTHPIDSAHFCSVAADPWAAPPGQIQPLDTRPPPFPFYRVIWGQSRAGGELARPGPSLGLALAGWTPGARTHADRTDDSVELVLQGRHFVGHAGLADQAWRLLASWDEDGRIGAFVAAPLLEVAGPGRPGGAILDLEGSWRCPPVQAEPAGPAPPPLAAAPVEAPRAHAAAPEVRTLVVFRTGRTWRMQEDGRSAQAAVVELRPLRLAPSLSREAARGEIELVVVAEVFAGHPPRVVARRLLGVQPHNRR
jgi:hypothetical protein